MTFDSHQRIPINVTFLLCILPMVFSNYKHSGLKLPNDYDKSMNIVEARRRVVENKKKGRMGQPNWALSLGLGYICAIILRDQQMGVWQNDDYKSIAKRSQEFTEFLFNM